jgi:hypothetical protein
MRHAMIVALMLGALIAQPLRAEESKPQEAPAKENFFKRAGKAIGRDAKAGWQKAKAGYAKAGRDIGHGTANAARRVGKEMKESAKRTGHAAKNEFK